jgi:hypothetical protein
MMRIVNHPLAYHFDGELDPHQGDENLQQLAYRPPMSKFEALAQLMRIRILRAK